MNEMTVILLHQLSGAERRRDFDLTPYHVLSESSSSYSTVSSPIYFVLYFELHMLLLKLPKSSMPARTALANDSNATRDSSRGGREVAKATRQHAACFLVEQRVKAPFMYALSLIPAMTRLPIVLLK